MGAFTNPALKAFLRTFQGETTAAQLLIRSLPPGFELRHLADRECESHSLRLIRLSEARQLAQFTAEGRFRPLKSAPTLQHGWRLELRDPEELAYALNIFYPGYLADWHAVQTGAASPTSFEAFTSRQTGMYRNIPLLSLEQASIAIRAACHPRSCLKQRLWSAEKAPPDLPREKSVIPCLEPCALLLEFSRRARRIEQEESQTDED